MTLLDRLYNLYSVRSKVNHFRRLRKKYSREASLIYPPDSIYEKEVQSTFKRILPVYKNMRWHRLYQNLNNHKEIWYVPEDIYYLAVEPYLNDYDLCLAYTDKNNYDRLFGESNNPKTVLRYMKGRFFSPTYEQLNNKEAEEIIKNSSRALVVKPTIHGTGRGRGVRLVESGEEKKSIIPFLKTALVDYTVQNKIEQSSQLSTFNLKCVNTFRILTFRQENDIVFLSSVLRMGRDHPLIDAFTGEEIFVRIDSDGRLHEFGFNDPLTRLFCHPDTNKSFKGVVIDGFTKAVNLCKQRHKKLPYFDLISWDVTLNYENEPVMVELNLKYQEINFHQITSGPLFGPYSEEVIKKSIENLGKSKYAFF